MRVYMQKWGNWAFKYVGVQDRALKIFLYLCKELWLLVLAVMGYRAALNHVFAVAGTDLTACGVISRMVNSFENCPPREIKPPEWNLSSFLYSSTT